MKKRALTFIIIAAFLLITACSGNQDALTSDSPENSMLENVKAEYNGAVTITFDFNKQSGWASNQFAVWIEDVDGNYVTTLYATRFTASGGFQNRSDALPEWVNRSGRTEMSGSEVDALTGATPSSGSLSYFWDTADVPGGEYYFFVEGNLRWSNRVLYSGVIEVGGEASTITAKVEYFYAASDN